MKRRAPAWLRSLGRAGAPLRVLVTTAPHGAAHPGRNIRRRFLIVLGFLSLLSGGLVASAAATQSEPSRKREAAEMLPLQPGDLIRLRVWREPDLSGEFPVNDVGIAVLPQLGPLDVMSEPPESLRARLVRQLESFLNHSAVDVVFLRRVQIAGAVREPGLYHLDPTMTLGDALALAGGVLPEGRTDKVEIFREGERLQGTISGRILISHSAVRSGDQLYVPERSWISRNPGTILAGISALTTLLYVVAR
jgi:protein involved in polysaccharide export with SLBB domain